MIDPTCARFWFNEGSTLYAHDISREKFICFGPLITIECSIHVTAGVINKLSSFYF